MLNEFSWPEQRDTYCAAGGEYNYSQKQRMRFTIAKNH
jgi:hypothetical protein